MSRLTRGLPVLAALTAALVAVPVSTAAAAQSLAITNADGEFAFIDDSVAVAVTPGSTLTLAASPVRGTVWNTGDLILVDAEVWESEVEAMAADESTADADAGEFSAQAFVDREDGSFIAGTITLDPAGPGLARAVLDPATPAGEYYALFEASGADENFGVAYSQAISVAAGAATTVALDFTSADFVDNSFLTLVSTVVSQGERITLTAPSGVSLAGFDVIVFDLVSDDEEPTVLVGDEVDAEISADGSSVSFTVPASFAAGTEFEVVLGSPFDENAESVELVSYFVSGFTVAAAPAATTTTTAKVPTAVPAGEGPIDNGVPVAPIALGGIALLAAGALLVRRSAAGARRL